MLDGERPLRATVANGSSWPVADRHPATPTDRFSKHKGQSAKKTDTPQWLLKPERRRSPPAWQEGRHRLLLSPPTVWLEFYPFERQADAASARSRDHDHLRGAVSDGFRLALPRDVLIREADRDTRDLRKAPALCHFAPLIVGHKKRRRCGSIRLRTEPRTSTRHLSCLFALRRKCHARPTPVLHTDTSETR